MRAHKIGQCNKGRGYAKTKTKQASRATKREGGGGEEEEEEERGSYERATLCVRYVAWASPGRYAIMRRLGDCEARE